MSWRNAYAHEFCWCSWHTHVRIWPFRGLVNDICWNYKNALRQENSTKCQGDARLVVEELLRSVINDDNVNSIEGLFTRLDDAASKSKTSKLWIDCFVRSVFIMMLYVLAEWEGHWPLQLVAESSDPDCSPQSNFGSSTNKTVASMPGSYWSLRWSYNTATICYHNTELCHKDEMEYSILHFGNRERFRFNFV